MAAVKIDVSVGGGGKRRCDLVTFEEVPRDVVLGDDVVVWYHVSACYRPKSGDWIGLFQCGDDDDDDDDDCCVSGTYSYVSFQWAPKYPNIEKSIPLRRVVFDNEQIKVEQSTSVYYRFLYMTTTMEQVVGCSNRFRVLLMLALPPSFVIVNRKQQRRRLAKAAKKRVSVEQAKVDNLITATATSSPATVTTTTATTTTAAADTTTTVDTTNSSVTASAAAADDETVTIRSPPTPPVSALMSDDDVTTTRPDPTQFTGSRDSLLSSEQPRREAGAMTTAARSVERGEMLLAAETTRRRLHQACISSKKQEIPHRDEDGSAMVEVVEDLVTSQSRDVQVTLGGWLNDERRMRQDVMTSQGLQQQALVDAARAAGQHLSALMKRLEQQDLRDDEDDDEDLEAVLDLANELMKSKSDDVELLRRWLESERKTQQRLVDLLFSADRNLSAVLEMLAYDRKNSSRKSSKSSVVTSCRQAGFCVHCSCASSHKDLRDDDDDDDNDEVGWTPITPSRPNTSKSSGVPNHSGRPGNRADCCKHSRCHATSSQQVRGGHHPCQTEAGNPRRHRHTTPADDDCCSDGQKRAVSDVGRTRARKAGSSAVSSDSQCRCRCSAWTSAPRCCPSSDSSLDVHCNNSEERDVTPCCNYLPCRTLPHSNTPTPCCHPQSASSACPCINAAGCCGYVKRCCVPPRPAPAVCCPVPSGQCRISHVVCGGGVSVPARVMACPLLGRLNSDVCQCGPLSDLGQAAVVRGAESQCVLLACCAGCCCCGLRPGSRPSAALHCTDVQSADQSSFRSTPVCCCCAASHVVDQSPSSPHPTNVVRSSATEKSQTGPGRVTQSRLNSYTGSGKDKRRVTPRTGPAAATVDRSTASVTGPSSSHAEERTAKPARQTDAATVAADRQKAPAPRSSGRVEQRHSTAESPVAADTCDTTSARTAAAARELRGIAIDLGHIALTELTLTAKLASDLAAPLHAALTEYTDSAAAIVMPSGEEFSGEELRQLLDDIAGIEHDVRAMSAALHAAETDTADTAAGVAKSSSFTVLPDGEPSRQNAVGGGRAAAAGSKIVTAGSGPTGRTTALALMLPAVELAVTSKDSPPSLGDDTTSSAMQTAHTAANTAAVRPTSDKQTSAAVLKSTKDANTYAAASSAQRVKVLPNSSAGKAGGGSKQSDYTKYALVPTGTSRLPFRQATTATAARSGLPTAQAKVSDTKRGETEDAASAASYSTAAEFQTSSSSADRPDVSDAGLETEKSDSGIARPHQFTGIQRIIQHLESLGSASASPGTPVGRPLDTTGMKRPKQRIPADSGGGLGLVDTDRKPQHTAVISSDADTQTGSSNASMKALVKICTRHTQTSPRSSAAQPSSPSTSAARLQDDKNATGKSRSLESQQQQSQPHQQLQQQLNGPAASAVMPTPALARSSGAVTSAAAQTAIFALPPPPSAAVASASPAGTGPETDTSDPESDGSGQTPNKTREKTDRKRKQS